MIQEWIERRDSIRRNHARTEIWPLPGRATHNFDATRVLRPRPGVPQRNEPGLNNILVPGSRTINLVGSNCLPARHQNDAYPD